MDTIWICFEAMITEKTLKEEATNKHHYDDYYSAPFAMLVERRSKFFKNLLPWDIAVLFF